MSRSQPARPLLSCFQERSLALAVAVVAPAVVAAAVVVVVALVIGPAAAAAAPGPAAVDPRWADMAVVLPVV